MKAASLAFHRVTTAEVLVAAIEHRRSHSFLISSGQRSPTIDSSPSAREQRSEKVRHAIPGVATLVARILKGSSTVNVALVSWFVRGPIRVNLGGQDTMNSSTRAERCPSG